MWLLLIKFHSIQVVDEEEFFAMTSIVSNKMLVTV
jgi:hypothetical protein